MVDSPRTAAPLAAELNRMILLLAGTVFVASIAVFCVIDITLRQGVIQELLVSVIPNITASVLIYIALYFSLSRASDLRKQEEQRELIEEILRRISVAPLNPSKGIQKSTPDHSDSMHQSTHVTLSQKIIIQRILEAIYAFSVTLSGNRDLRLYCHLTLEREGVLHPICIVNGTPRADYDYRADIPYQGVWAESFVIAKALSRRRIVAEDMVANHSSLYPDRLKGQIPEDLKCVVASPIESYDPGDNSDPLGTIAIDSTSATCSELGFTSQTGVISDGFDNMLKSCSRVLYQVLTTQFDIRGDIS
jgi:hypothetical protein